MYKILNCGRNVVGVLVILLTVFGLSCSSDDRDPTPFNSDAGDNNSSSDANNERDSGDSGSADGPLALPELSEAVTVRLSPDGVLHLDCKVDRDCFIAQGYYHAAHRFIQMDLMRNQTRGRLSTMLGLALGRDNDRFWRHRLTTEEGDTLEELYFDAASDTTKANFRAYTEGVNAWLDHLKAEKHGAKLSAEYSSGLLYDKSEIRPWEPEDSVMLYLNLSYTWSFGEGTAQFASLVNELDIPEVADDLASYPGGVLSYTMSVQDGQASRAPLQIEHSPIDWKKRFDAHAPLLQEMADQVNRTRSFIAGPLGRFASNNWVLSPSRTQDGSALLATDPHLDMTNPPIWYMVEMRSQEQDARLHVAGASVPGAPGIILGHNENIAWGATVAGYQLSDTYLETLTPDGNAVERNGSRVELVSREFEIEGRGDSTTETFEWVPGHGPLVQKDEEAGTGLSVKWVGHEPGNDIDFITDLMYATNVAEAREAIDPIRVVNMNWLIADTQGSIGWFPQAKAPERRPWVSLETPHYAPLPGDGSAEWNGYVDAADIPELLDPPSGYIATTNNHFRDNWWDGNPYNDGVPALQVVLDHGGDVRHARASELIEASTDHTVESMRQIQGDTISHFGVVLMPELLGASTDLDGALSETGLAVLEALRAWNYDCPTGLETEDPDSLPSADAETRMEAIGCSVFHTTLRSLAVELVGDEIADLDRIDPYDAWKLLSTIVVGVFVEPETLAHGENYFDDVTTEDIVETREDVLVASFERAATWLSDAFESTDSEDWLWGRIHRFNMNSLVPLPQYGLGPFATPGGYHTLARATPVGDSFDHVDGGSVRMIFKLNSDGVESHFQLPGGQVHHTDSPHYDDLLEKWLRTELTRMLFDPADVADSSASEREIQPTTE